MKIGIIPTIINRYPGQFETALDLRIVKLFNQISKNNIYHILIEKKKIDLDLIILAGGNDCLSKNIKNIIRKKLDNFFILYGLKYKIPIVGICYGAQLIAKMYGAKLVKTKKHVKNVHKILNNGLVFKNIKKSFLVNSYHEYKIVNYNSKFEKILNAEDGSTEFFKIKKKEIYGIMWHPERYKKFKSTDLKILKKICNL